MHRLGGNQRALLARVRAHISLIAEVEKRGKRSPRFNLPRRYVLRNPENIDVGVIALIAGRADVCKARIGSAQIYANVHC